MVQKFHWIYNQGDAISARPIDFYLEKSATMSLTFARKAYRRETNSSSRSIVNFNKMHADGGQVFIALASGRAHQVQQLSITAFVSLSVNLSSPSVLSSIFQIRRSQRPHVPTR
jgi:hypothetical protein